MVPPTGEQYAITHGGYRATLTQGGATLRELSYDGRDLIDPFAESEMPAAGRGQVLVPWPNRIRDGRYTWEGTPRQLPLSEPARANASHGLVRWAAWHKHEHRADAITLRYRLMAQSGYPWTLDLTLTYALSHDGLTVTYAAINRSSQAAPFAAGFHPYLRTTAPLIDAATLSLPAGSRVVTDERLLPIGDEPTDGTAYEFAPGRALGDLSLDDAFGDLRRGSDGRTHVTLTLDGVGAGLWMDDQHHWVQVFSADEPSAGARRAIAVEPMTSPADAFNSGRDLITLAPGGEFRARWGIYAI
ncbi:MAG: aldose 1-epimerase family protein [Nocardioides sp.]|jgi:aldose 1-epimerase